jgi:hypothetical protein
LAVAHVVWFLVGEVVDIGEERWEVVVCHVLEGELPELCIGIWVEFTVVAGVFVASAVA